MTKRSYPNVSDERLDILFGRAGGHAIGAPATREEERAMAGELLAFRRQAKELQPHLPKQVQEWCPRHGNVSFFLGIVHDDVGDESLFCPLCHPNHPDNPTNVPKEEANPKPAANLPPEADTPSSLRGHKIPTYWRNFNPTDQNFAASFTRLMSGKPTERIVLFFRNEDLADVVHFARNDLDFDVMTLIGIEYSEEAHVRRALLLAERAVVRFPPEP